jgi:2-amino-4-hydroxy-6-hydroxymethyldihydropteridine diphosphokinase
MSVHLVYCGVGSNLGDRAAYLSRGAEALSAHPEITFLRKSGMYETEPEREEYPALSSTAAAQPKYLNTVWEFKTTLLPYDLLHVFMRIEESFGRDRKHEVRRGPRVLDLDILFYDDWVIQDNALTIPHPRLHKRRFVLEPLTELAPNLVHPVLRTTVWTLLSGLAEAQTVL